MFNLEHVLNYLFDIDILSFTALIRILYRFSSSFSSKPKHLNIVASKLRLSVRVTSSITELIVRFFIGLNVEIISSTSFLLNKFGFSILSCLRKSAFKSKAPKFREVPLISSIRNVITELSRAAISSTS